MNKIVEKFVDALIGDDGQDVELKNYVVVGAIPGYGHRLYTNNDSCNDLSREVQGFLSDLCIWGGVDKTLNKYHRNDSCCFNSNSCVRSWEFDDEGIKIAVQFLKERGFSEGFDLAAYPYHH